DTNEPVLKGAFEQHGEILEVKVICDHKSGKSKGYGFVQFTSETAATTALKEMDGQEYSGAICTQGITSCIMRRNGGTKARNGDKLQLHLVAYQITIHFFYFSN
ncbi:hypothetical protein TorRG33x02_357160, partial [Trema orientale]